MLPENRKSVLAIIKELTPLIIGKKVEGFECNCGCVKADGGTASRIDPGGDSYPGQETNWFLWSVDVACPETNKIVHSRDLTHFMPVVEIDAMFEKHFGNDEAIIQGRVKAGEVYNFPNCKNLPVSKRPQMCKVRDNDRFTSITMEWGANQIHGKIVNEVSCTGTSFNAGTPLYKKLLEILNNQKLNVIIGGPRPELPQYESRWLSNWPDVLKILSSTKFKSVDLHCIGQSGDQYGWVYTCVTFTLYK